MKKNKTLILTATYNEAECIENLITRIKNAAPECSILVIDDNSPDGTGRILDNLKEINPNLKTIHRPSKSGIGSAHKEGIKYAMDHEYEFLITMDADHSHNPEDIPRFIAGLSEHDFIIGSRYISGGSCDYGFFRLSLSRAANFFSRIFLNLPQQELTTSFRGYRVSSLKNIPLEKIRSEHYGFFVEFCYLLNAHGANFKEIPIRFEDRKAGKTKISTWAIIQGFLVFLRLSFKKKQV